MKADKRIGRPVKRPGVLNQKQLDPLNYFKATVWKILKKCDAPDAWGEREINLILKMFFEPHMLNVKDDEESEFRCFKIETATGLARLFYDAPDTMIDALPRIRKAFRIFVSSPFKALLYHVAIEMRLANNRNMPDCFRHWQKRFWNEKAHILAQELRSQFGIQQLTARTVEDVRKSLRATV